MYLFFNIYKLGLTINCFYYAMGIITKKSYLNQIFHHFCNEWRNYSEHLHILYVCRGVYIYIYIYYKYIVKCIILYNLKTKHCLFSFL